ncbi:MAG TPA: bifunctional 3,4-dihydroxy-2-butanone-4-phosphate synthase/GTP cyclohydrolase II [Burkholderiaceae bacterium]|nr:bifunctional 3,4-dihydroxy-2-butanone-4-phosphate synthase/GTP cyclohydrolase II [Burkholderiaceae bacterium]
MLSANRSTLEPAAGAPIASAAEIVEEIRRGQVVVLVDDEDRENEGDLVFAADFVTAEKVNFLARFGRGLICMPITEEHARRLQLSPMSHDNRSVHGTNFTVAIEAASGVTTGISAADRAHTIRVASRPDAKPEDIVQPGHVFPLVARPGGVLMRAGHTEACCDLARLAGLNPSAVLCEIMNDDGTMARLPDLSAFVRLHGLKLGTIADLIHYRAATESLIERIGQRTVQTAAGTFELIAYRDVLGDGVHLALVRGVPRLDRDVLVRVHEPLSVLDLVDGATGRHSWTPANALQRIAREGCGVLVLLNCGESPQRLQQRIRSWSATHEALPAPRAAAMDLRTYGIGAQILRDLGVGRMKLMAKPRKMPSMAGFGLVAVSYLESE